MSENNKTQEQPKVEIAVKNFGPIAEANIDLRPLTVFVGPSNTGKTYFATLVYSLHGAFNGFSNSSLFTPFVKRPGKVMEILSDLLTDLAIPKHTIQEILKKLEMSERQFRLSDFPKETRQKLDRIIKDNDFFKEVLQEELTNCFDLDSVSEVMRITGEKRHEVTLHLKIGEETHQFWNIMMKVSHSEIDFDFLHSLSNPSYDNLVLLPEGWRASGNLTENDKKVRIDRFGTRGGYCRYYLPAARSGIMHSCRIVANTLITQITRIGQEHIEIPTLSGVIADFMQRIVIYAQKKGLRNKMKQLADTLETEVLAGKILINPFESGYPGIRYLPQGNNEEIPLSQSSSMVSELAPLVLYLRGYVNPGDTLIIEEPEAHLHPGAQADMAIILARLVRAGVKVIITTHSDWLLQEIGNLILEGLIESEIEGSGSWLSPEEVGIWHFQKDEAVSEIPFHSIKGFSPKDYHDVAEGLYNRSVNLQQLYEKQSDRGSRESE